MIERTENVRRVRDVQEVAAIHMAVDRVRNWYHRIEVAPGVVTPGIHDSASELTHLDQLGLPKDCSSMRALDIGCRDGFFAFELERRGASVVAIDYLLPTASGFSVAHDLLGSNVEYLVENVYDLSPDRHGDFDLVLFLGVLYHLRDPILALDRVRAVTKPGGLLFLETHLLDNYVRLDDGTTTSLDALSPQLLRLPLWRFYAGDTLNKDATDKWAPSMAGLQQALEETRFRVRATEIVHSRGYALANAVEDPVLNRSRLVDRARAHCTIEAPGPEAYANILEGRIEQLKEEVKLGEIYAKSMSEHLAQLKREAQSQDAYLQSVRDHFVRVHQEGERYERSLQRHVDHLKHEIASRETYAQSLQEHIERLNETVQERATYAQSLQERIDGLVSRHGFFRGRRRQRKKKTTP
jgi:tRNA (mo5U34)-methyltransferase